MPDDLRRLQAVLGGRLHGPYRNLPGRAPSWQWVLDGSALAEAEPTIRPLLGRRRQAQWMACEAS